jgi:hypothetical protein
MKAKVIKFFQNLPEAKHDQFNKAFELYRQSNGKNPVTERVINAQGFTPSSLDNLLYDLQKMHGITDVEKVSVVESQKSKLESEEEIEKAKWDSLDNEIASMFLFFLAVYPEHLNDWTLARHNQFGDVEELLELSKNVGIKEVSDKLQLCVDYLNSPVGTEANATNTELNPVSTEVGTEVGVLQLNPDSEIPGTQETSTDELDLLKAENEELQSEKEDLEFEKEGLEEEVEDLKNEVETLKLTPKLTAKAIRVEFPFLNDKDCPDEMKILMADKITAWNHYLELQEQFLAAEIGKTIASKEDLAILGEEAIKAFTENQKIYDELNAYQTTGKILGLHPLFKKLQLTREVETMTSEELVKYKGSSAKYFTDNRKSLAKAEKAKDDARILEINTRVEDRAQKLALVNKRLGIPVK